MWNDYNNNGIESGKNHFRTVSDHRHRTTCNFNYITIHVLSSSTLLRYIVVLYTRLPFFIVDRHGLAVFVPRHGRFGMSFGRIAFQDGRVTGRRVHILGLHPKVLFQICNNNAPAYYECKYNTEG